MGDRGSIGRRLPPAPVPHETPWFDGNKDPSRRLAAERGSVELRATISSDAAGPDYSYRTTVGAYRKTSLTYAVQIPRPFQVETLEGLHDGKAGDYLAIGVHGEMYPIDAAVFESSYEKAKP